MDRRTAREIAFKTLFEQDINKNNEIDTTQLNTFTKQIVLGVCEKKNELDQLISDHLYNWSYDRIALVEKTILRMSVFEIIYLDDIPVGASINEAVELANRYGDDKSGGFVNGILSNINNQKENE